MIFPIWTRIGYTLYAVRGDTQKKNLFPLCFRLNRMHVLSRLNWDGYIILLPNRFKATPLMQLKFAVLNPKKYMQFILHVIPLHVLLS